MTGEVHEKNGYIRVQTLAAIVIPVVGALVFFINLSIAPVIKDVDQNKLDLRDLRTQIVPRGEHQEKWNSQAATDDELRREIKELRDQVGAQYTMRDELLRLQKMVECLQAGTCKVPQAN